jgi:hypothetical protein
MEAEKKGKTLWEMLQDRLHGGGNGAGISFYNPLGLNVGSAVSIPSANGPEFADYDFSVQEIREYTRRIGAQNFAFTDYALRGVYTKTFDANKAMSLRLRSVPNESGAHDSLLLRLYDEFAFSEDFLGVLKDDSGTLDVTEDESNSTTTFSRINELRVPYEAAVLLVSQTTPEGKAAKSSALKLEYWDFGRDMDLGNNRSAKEFLFAEMNSDTGWFQLWRGREFFSD